MNGGGLLATDGLGLLLFLFFLIHALHVREMEPLL